MRTIFLSYRRQDSADICDRLNDHLGRRYGADAVFRDVSTIMAGSEFPLALRLALEDCRAMVVVIGPTWLDARDARGMRRLDDPSDWVRIEVATGLREGKLVIPVLVRGARLPTSHELPEDLRMLAECPPTVLRSGPAFQEDVQALFRALGRTARGGPPHMGLIACGSATILALLAFMIVIAEPSLASAAALTVPANERLVEVAIGLETLRIVGTRRWVWLAAPIATFALQIVSVWAGPFSLVIILFVLCVLPIVMGMLGPSSSIRPLGVGSHPRWRLLGIGIVAASALAIIGDTFLWIANALHLWRFVTGANTQTYYVFAFTVFGLLLVAWGLMLLYTLASRRWISSIVWLLAAVAYTPAAVLMARANTFPIFLGVFEVVLLGMGWWVVRQPASREPLPVPAQTLTTAAM
ncbi:MAG TPA: toll/interleukin-1 receptor domain-containing protein [Ktedonobacterales bacterium]